MNINELLTEFPLVEKEKEYFDSTFSIMKEVLPKVVSQQMNMELPEKVVSEICQIFFYVTINIESALNEQYKFGIDLVNTNFQKQLNIFREDISNIARNAMSRGVPKDNILEYLSCYFQETFEKLFPNQKIILG